MFKLRALFFVTIATLLTGVPAALAEAGDGQAKNVIFLLGDGMGPAQVKAYRAYADDPATAVIEPLVFDHIQTGAVATDSVVLVCAEDGKKNCVRNPYGVTDSAASATAYATGVDTLNGRLGIDVDGKPLMSVLTLAARQGMGTGVVSTSQVTHASPAAFVVNVPKRRQYPDIADQFFDLKVGGQPRVQVILGGGVRDFRRKDRDIVREFITAGYGYVETSTSLAAADSIPLLGLFAPVGLPRHWDRPDDAPSLAMMTRKALDLLAANEKGFFLMIEGSQIDWAAHGNDIAGVISEMDGFHEAAAVVLDFAAARGDTLVVMTADHETGGLSLGREGVYEWNPGALRGMTATPAVVTTRFLQDEKLTLSEVFAQVVAFELSDEERAGLDSVERDESAVYRAITALIDQRTLSGWSTDGHTGVDVPLYATGPGSEVFRGVLQNETLGQLLIDAVQR